MLNYIHEFYKRNNTVKNNNEEESPSPSCNGDDCEVPEWVIILYIALFFFVLIIAIIALSKCWNTFPTWANTLFIILILLSISYSPVVQQIGVTGELYLILYWLIGGCQK